MRRAKIVATLGPASDTLEMIQELIRAGMNVARLNFSHGDHASHGRTISRIREASNNLSAPVAIMQDLQGLKIRTGELENSEPVDLIEGQSFVITTEAIKGNRKRVSTSYASLPRDVTVGNRILLSDGLLELLVTSTTDTDVECEVITGGRLAQNQGIHLPQVSISASGLTEKDRADLAFGIEHKIDWVALSYIQSSEDIHGLKKELASLHSDIPIIAKLETPLAIKNLEAIMEACEAVMVARGDLGVELSPEKVPVIQKLVIARANQLGKPVITATQMLESMVSNPRPTRAEASDVANAIFDGSDAVMLSAETTKGRYPLESVGMMAKIIDEAERAGSRSHAGRLEKAENLSFPEAVCNAAFHASKSINARAIVVFTQTGSTARIISRFRPSADIFALTPHASIMNRMALYWGVHPLQMPEITNVEQLIQELERLLLKLHLVVPGDNLIILTGAPIIERGNTTLMKLHEVKA
ncbi:MAG: pyruvate kinase [Acidobacteriota bacterium]